MGNPGAVHPDGDDDGRRGATDSDVAKGPSQKREKVHAAGTDKPPELNKECGDVYPKSKPDDDHLSIPLYHRPRLHSTSRAGLHLQTRLDGVHITAMEAATRRTDAPTLFESLTSTESPQPSPSFLSMQVQRTNSMASSVCSSAHPSPLLGAIQDITPLPSPSGSAIFSAGSWKRTFLGTPSSSRHGSLDAATHRVDSAAVITPPSPKQRKCYGSLEAPVVSCQAVKGKTHGRNRSISDFVPEQLQNIRQRHVTFGPGDAESLEAGEYCMQREAYIAAQRGLENPGPMPTPPASTGPENDESPVEMAETPYLEDGSRGEYFAIRCGLQNKQHLLRQLRKLGQGSFSTVYLATGEQIPARVTHNIESLLDRDQLVAVKIVQHGPVGGADEKRIEMGLKREVEMLKSVSHPSLIHLKACEYQATRTLLVLTYCPGGDLFELASRKRDILTPLMVQRMFAELVGAVHYLHLNGIVHRDIKLENVLVNFTEDRLRKIEDPRFEKAPIVTLTDMGLSRRIPPPPELLTTRCGSDDYVAPEIILGSGYDGQKTDAWALGVVLYALMEGRLPFDPPADKPRSDPKNKPAYRIAKVDYIWYRFGDSSGDWEEGCWCEWQGARECVEDMLKKVRMGRVPLGEIAERPWVREGIQVPGGL
ncbi:kinase-like protein [Piedraia hortae CBS 480.64]|uniref:non-specific serine/threonine protein kinase n=1 Tax=Piedraia hortae CBS 480.64 TaxID=1314780 RepID=A0A6A7BPK6_9PEZI|nr:kinase-like protein [Piedraia hortae CBS 480.64]